MGGHRLRRRSSAARSASSSAGGTIGWRPAKLKKEIAVWNQRAPRAHVLGLASKGHDTRTLQAYLGIATFGTPSGTPIADAV